MKKYFMLLIIVIVPLLLCTGCIDYMNEKEVTCEIQDKWIKRSGEDDIYLVQCDDNVYKITDLLFYGKFDSSDIYARLKIGKKYKLSISGYRWQYFSEYPNINKYEELVEEDNNE